VRAQRHALQGREAEDAGVGTAAEKARQGLKSEQCERFKTRTTKTKNLHLGADPGPLRRPVRRTLLGGCALGSNRLGGRLSRAADSGAAPLLPAGSRTALRSLGCSRAILLTSAASEVGPWPPPAGRETYTSEAPPPRMIKD
jgi:hypothetical protein